MNDFNLLPELLRNQGIELASSKSTYEYYDSLSRTLLSSLMWNYEGSEAAKKRQAESCEEYKNHLLLVYEHRKTMLTHEAHLKWLEAEFDYMRSMNANRRAETRM